MTSVNSSFNPKGVMTHGMRTTVLRWWDLFSEVRLLYLLERLCRDSMTLYSWAPDPLWLKLINMNITQQDVKNLDLNIKGSTRHNSVCSRSSDPSWLCQLQGTMQEQTF